MRKPYLIYPVLSLIIFFVTACQNDENSPPIPGVITHFTDVTSNSMVMHWTRASDADTFQPYLEYKVVASNNNVLDTLDNALANGIVMTYDDPETEEVERIVWNRDITSMLLNYYGFADGQTYYFTVIVRDAAWRQSAYPMASQKTIDITAPVVGELSIVDETGETLGLEWTAATDNGTNQEDLEYKVVFSSANNISTVATAEANGSIIPDWEPDWKTIEDGQLPVMVTSPTTVTEYFNVLVRDSSTDAANVSVYKAVSRQPTPGGAGRVTADDITETSCTLTWEPATDFGTEQNALQYQVVQSTQSDPVLAWSPNTTTFTATGLSTYSSYTFTISVKDEDGYIVDYNRVSIRTLDADSQLQASINRESMSLPEASFAITDGLNDFASADASLPLQLSGGGHLLVWLDGSDVLGNGSSHEGPVSLWKDKSGMGNHAVQAEVENQPVVTAGNLFGGRQVVRFDAGNENFMAVPLGENLDIIKSTQGYTVFLVAANSKSSSDAVASERCLFAGKGDSSDFLGMFDKNDELIVKTSMPLLVQADKPVSGFVAALLQEKADKETGVVLNIMDTSYPAFLFSKPESVDEFLLGAFSADSGFWDGELAEFILFDRALTADEYALMKQYLETKWGIQTSGR